MGRFWQFTKVRLSLAAVLLATFFSSGAALAEFSLSPLRQVIDPDTQSVTYEISNPSSRTLSVQISWIDLEAVETGYAPARPNLRKKLSAAPFLIVSPSFLTLEPGARETITVQRRGGLKSSWDKLPKNERRSHLLVEASASRTLLRKAGGGVQLDMETGLSTPVILRPAKGTARAQIKEAKLLRRPDGLLEMETIIVPKGSLSAYGRLAIFFQADGSEVETEIASLANVSAYLDASRRRSVIPLEIKQFSPGIVTIKYLGQSEFTGTEFARRSFKTK